MACLSISAVSNAWQIFTPEDESFVVTFPAAPEYEQSPGTFDGMPVLNHIFSVSTSDGSYVLSYTESSSPTQREMAPEEAMEAALDLLVLAVGGKVLTDNIIPFHGHPGRDVWVRTANGRAVHLRMYAVADRFYKLLTMAKGQTGNVEESERFIESFDVRPSRSQSIQHEANSSESIVMMSYWVPGHGTVDLAVPKSWRVVNTGGEDEPPLTLKFLLDQGSSSMFMLSLAPMNLAEFEGEDTVELRRRVLRGGEELLPESVENRVQVRILEGRDVVGYYFSLTDKAPKPDEYGYITQGAAIVGDLVMTFTLLSMDDNSISREQVVELVKSARHRLEVN